MELGKPEMSSPIFEDKNGGPKEHLYRSRLPN